MQTVATQQQMHLERGMRICGRNNTAGTKFTKEGEGGDVAGTRAEIHLQPTVMHGRAVVD